VSQINFYLFLCISVKKSMYKLKKLGNFSPKLLLFDVFLCRIANFSDFSRKIAHFGPQIS